MKAEERDSVWGRRRATGVGRAFTARWPKSMGTVLSAHLAIGIGVILTLFPIYWMIISSFRPTGELFSKSTAMWPSTISWEHYKFAFDNAPLARGLLNSLLIAGTKTAVGSLLAALAGYAFAKHRFPGRDLLFLLVLGTMMVPPEIGIVPLFVIISRLHWVNTYQAIVVPYLVTGLGIFLMRQYIAAIPDSLLDAARIDGAGELNIFWRVILPITSPGLVTLMILTFVSSWNDFLWPLIALRTRDMYTVQLVVSTLPAVRFSTPWGAVMAASTVAVAPLVVVFLVFQRYFTPTAIGAVRE